MRICSQCQSEMVEGFGVRVERTGYGIQIVRGTGLFAKRMEKPKVAICPKCGEVSMYVEILEEIRNSKD